jgi:hypothetical protein
MTELIAVSIKAMQYDAQQLKAKSLLPSQLGLSDDIIQAFEDPQVLEADAYTIFFRIIHKVRFLYEASGEDILNEHWKKVHHIWLKSMDPLLYFHLMAAGIEPQLYLLRWYRLVFLREFSFENLLFIWDYLFSSEKDSISLIDLLDCLSLAMILFVRDAVLHAGTIEKNNPIRVFQCISQFPEVNNTQLHQIFDLARTFESRKMPTEVKSTDVELLETIAAEAALRESLAVKIRSGFMHKIGGGTTPIFGRKNLKKRWFVLQGDVLSYFSDEKSKKPLKNKRINLKGFFEIRLSDVNKFGLELHPINSEDPSHPYVRIFHLYASSYEEMMDWFDAFIAACSLK